MRFSSISLLVGTLRTYTRMECYLNIADAESTPNQMNFQACIICTSLFWTGDMAFKVTLCPELPID